MFVSLCYHAKLGLRQRTPRLVKVWLVGHVVITRGGRGGGSLCCVSDMVGIFLRCSGIEMSSQLRCGWHCPEGWRLWISITNAVCGSAYYKHLGLRYRADGVVVREVGVMLVGSGVEVSSQLKPLTLLLHASSRVGFEAEAFGHLDVARLQRSQCCSKRPLLLDVSLVLGRLVRGPSFSDKR